MELNLVKLVLRVKPELSSALVPLVSGKGSAFEDALRQVCCTTGKYSCSDCSIYQSCPVRVLIAKELSSNPDILRRHQKPALPYIFKRIDTQDPDSNEIGLTLLGAACSCLTTLLAAVEHFIGREHCFSSITALDYQNLPVPLDISDLAAINNMPVLAASELVEQQSYGFINCKRVQLVLQTPLRLVKEMRELNYFEPVLFSRSVVRRVSSLIAHYGDSGGNSDQFRYLAECSCKLSVVKVYDCNKKSNEFIRGVTGCYELLGIFDELGPFLYLGSLLHVGKRASYGMGSFAITPIS